MKRLSSSWLLVFAWAATALAQEPQPKPDFPPLSPLESLRVTHLRDGFEMELMAAEPMVLDPVAIDWGPDGKLWVAEMADYPLGIDGKGKAGGRIRYLEDTDGDGKYDKSTLFMTGVNFPTGVLPWRSGVVVTAAPEIFYAADTNGDGKADLRETLYRGFVEGNTQLRVNGLQWGLDGWVYCANGWSGGKVHGVKSKVEVDISGRDFRIHLDDNQADAQSGVSEFGRNRDDWGNWFGCDNAHPLFHFPLGEHYVRRNPHAAPPDPKLQVVVPESPKIFAVSPPEKRFHSFADSERFTSACSAIIYRDSRLFPGDQRRHTFVCEPVHNLVHHEVLTPHETTFTAARPPEEQASEFIASEDRWFRPVQVRTGPDGALWVVDMYRYIIEHPEWMPPEGKQYIEPFQRLGEDRGRLYRVFLKGEAPKLPGKMNRLPAAQLVKELESSSGWRRDTAQRLLVERRDQASILLLERMLASSKAELGRLHALCALGEMDALAEPSLIKALNDSHPSVRRQALRLSETRESAAVVAAAARLTEDADPQVRLQLACSLGSWKDETVGKTLAALWIAHHQDPYLAAAVFSSLTADNLEPMFAVALAVDPANLPLDKLLAQAAAMGRVDLLAKSLSTVLSRDDVENVAARTLGAVLDVIERQGISLDKVVATASAADLAGQVDHQLEHARRTAFDDRAPLESRILAVRLVGRAAGEDGSSLAKLADLLTPQSAPELQQAVVAHLGERNRSEVASLLLTGWASHTPALRAQILEVLLRRPEWIAVLLDALEKKDLVPADLDATARQRLLGLPDANLKARAEQLIAAGTVSRQQVLVEFQSVLEMPGEARQGAELFKTKCSVCHRLGDVGQEVGPNIAALTDKSPRTLLTAMLDPSQAVEARYLNYIAQTSDGLSFSGILVAETATSVTLLAQNGQKHVLLRGDLEALQSTGKSLMPDGLEKELSKQQIADLLEFLKLASSK